MRTLSPSLYANSRHALALGLFCLVPMGLSATPQEELLQRAGTSCAWQQGFHGIGPDGRVLSSAVFDDGNGPAIYVGGELQFSEDATTISIAKWDGSSWSSLGDEVNQTLSRFIETRSMTTYDDGGGDALYFVHGQVLYRWDGSHLDLIEGPDPDSRFEVINVYDDGQGNPRLVAAGELKFDGVEDNVAFWDGSSWTGTGFTDIVMSSANVFDDFETFDDGSGVALYMGGNFDGSSRFHLAKWNGSSWSPIFAPTFNGGSNSLAVFDDGSGAKLYAGGAFLTEDLDRYLMAVWDGKSFSLMEPTPSSTSIRSIFSHEGPGGNHLYVAGNFQSIGGISAPSVARWNGAQWSTVGNSSAFQGRIEDWIEFQEPSSGPQPSLFAAGSLNRAGSSTVRGLARWSQETWSTVSSGTGNGADQQVFDLLSFNDGSGEALYAAGFFRFTGTVQTNHIARWDGNSWHSLGSGVNGPVRVLATHDDGSGAALHIGGEFTAASGSPLTRLAKWQNNQWSEVGGGVNGTVHAIQSLQQDGQGLLFVGGEFTRVGGIDGIPVQNVAVWDGSQWFDPGLLNESAVYDFEIFDFGSGPALVAAGKRQIARLQGGSWVSLGASDLNTINTSLTVFDLGDGPQLIAARATDVYRWHNDDWQRVGGDFNLPGNDAPGSVVEVGAYDDGLGTSLFAVGNFRRIDSSPVSFTARWNGAQWVRWSAGQITEALDFSGAVQALALFNDGNEPALYVGGSMTEVQDRPSRFLGKHVCPQIHIFSDGFESGNASEWSFSVP